MGSRIGIDLGTTFSLVARLHGDRAVVIDNALGERQTPSVVSIREDGEVLVGAAARARAVTHPEATFRNFKRDMGTDKVFRFGEHAFRPEQLSALVLRQLGEDAEAALGESIDEAVVTVPAYFGELQRRATRDACELAGLHVERIINEPTAAALAYGLDRRDRESRVVVLDLGGGTFDVSVLEIIEGVIEIQGTAGDAQLGGEDFLMALVDRVARRAGIELAADARRTAQLIDACERAKQALSSELQVEVIVPDARSVVVTREEAEGLWHATLSRMHAPIRRALRDAKTNPDAIDEVVLVGGATRMPIVRRLAEELFGRPALTDVSPDEAVAQGAAIQVALKADVGLDDLVATDIAPFSLGVSTVETRGRRRIDDMFSPILERGTVLPASRVERFVTAADDQTEIRVEVYQGEHSRCRDNTKLGEFELKGIPRGPAGTEAIDVRFTYDLNGILEVDMTIVSTSKSETLLLQRSRAAMSAEQLVAAREALARLKFHPREALPNTTALARAESLFTELRGPERDMLGHAMRSFRLALEEQDMRAIEGQRNQLLSMVQRLRR